jgi:opacity protein-like surface antigen
MQKRIVLALLMAALLAGGAFAQASVSAGVGGNFGVYSISMSHPDWDIDNPKPIVGVGFNAFFDASYVMVKFGMFIGGNSEEEKIPYAKVFYETTYTFLSLGLLGKYPIDLGNFTLFPMLGFEYNIFLNSKYTMNIGGVSSGGTIDRSDLADDHASDLDMFILQLGLGADFNLSEQIYLRPSVLWGIDLASSESEKTFRDNKGTIFKSKFDIGIALGFKF